ncbi:hypothetical protein M2142_001502 [Fusobacterium sp. PH5-29]
MSSAETLNFFLNKATASVNGTFGSISKTNA